VRPWHYFAGGWGLPGWGPVRTRLPIPILRGRLLPG
jgi:hypothetical protein